MTSSTQIHVPVNCISDWGLHCRAYTAYERLAGFMDVPSGYSGAEILRACDALSKLGRRSREPPVLAPVPHLQPPPPQCVLRFCTDRNFRTFSNLRLKITIFYHLSFLR